VPVVRIQIIRSEVPGTTVATKFAPEEFTTKLAVLEFLKQYWCPTTRVVTSGRVHVLAVVPVRIQYRGEFRVKVTVPAEVPYEVN